MTSEYREHKRDLYHAGWLLNMGYVSRGHMSLDKVSGVLIQGTLNKISVPLKGYIMMIVVTQISSLYPPDF